MKQIALSIEQMNHLESLGLDTSDASMYHYIDIAGNYYDTLPADAKTYPKMGKIPAYTLQDIQEILNDAFCYIATDYTCIWAESFKSNERMVEFDSDDMLLNTYNMLLWCIENNYIKTNKV